MMTITAFIIGVLFLLVLMLLTSVTIIRHNRYLDTEKKLFEQQVKYTIFLAGLTNDEHENE